MSRIYLIRHGKTRANEQHLYCGSTDLPLSEAGREELQQLHYNIKDARFFTTGMKRTEQTLRILFGPVEFQAEPELREIDFGAFEMQSYAQLKDREDYQQWLTGDNEKNVPPGGESGEQMEARVVRAFLRLRSTGENLVIVAHGGTISAIMARLFPEEGKNRYQWQPRPGHGYVLEGNSWKVLEAE